MKDILQGPGKYRLAINLGMISCLVLAGMLLSHLLLESTTSAPISRRLLYVSASSIIIVILSGQIYLLYRTKKTSVENEQCYWALLERFPEAVAVYCAGEIVFINRKGLKMLAAKNKSEVINQPVTAFLQGSDADRFKSTPSSFATENNLHIKINCLSGKTKDIEITSIPVHMNGQLATLVVAKDITIEKIRERELWDTNEKLNTIIDACPVSIAALDLEGHVKLWNPAAEKMFGWKQEEIMNKKIPSLPEGFSDDFLKKLIASGPHVGIETERQRKDGALLDVILSTAPMKDIEGNLIGSMGIMADITEFKKTEQLLRKTEKLSSIGELAAGIAHEIRNPLTAVKGFIQLMSHTEHNKYFDVMLAEIDSIEDIIHEMLVLAKPHAVHFEKTNLKETLDQVVSLCTSQAILKNIELELSIEPGLPLIHCEENQMKQVFINLLKNSMEAMPDGGKIKIQAGFHSDQVNIRFVDQGCGIEKKDIPKLGEPFYTTKRDGTGLGLMRCYKVVENHSGSMSIHSEVGKGTTINLILPPAYQQKTVS